MKKFLMILICLLFSVSLLAGSASALTLTLKSGVGSFTDTDPDDNGVVSWNTNEGDAYINGWGVSATGTSDPMLAGPYPHMDLSSVSIYTGPTLPVRGLHMWLSDIWAADVPELYNRLSGSVGDGMTVEFRLYYNNPNPKGTDSPLYSYGTFGTGVFSLTDESSLPDLTGEYSLTLYALVRATQTNQVTSFDWELKDPGGSNPVPEPASMLLVGAGLVGLAGLGRKKFFKKG